MIIPIVNAETHVGRFAAWPVKPHQIVSLRQRLGKTQVEFARMLSADPATVSRWESGRSKPRRIYIRVIIKMMQEHS